MVISGPTRCCAGSRSATALSDLEDLRAQALAALDPYLDSFWGILRNKVHARTSAELEQAETDLVFAQAVKMAEDPVVGRYDLPHLQTIHRRLFGDVYPFAGHLRTVNLRKADDLAGWFTPARALATDAAKLFSDLAAEQRLRRLPLETFTARAGHYLDRINRLHPFREGNGRTQRIFLSQLAAQAGYHLNWPQITPEQNELASRAGEGPLTTMLAGIVEPTGGRSRLVDPQQRAVSFALHSILTVTAEPAPQPGVTRTAAAEADDEAEYDYQNEERGNEIDW